MPSGVRVQRSSQGKGLHRQRSVPPGRQPGSINMSGRSEVWDAHSSDILLLVHASTLFQGSCACQSLYGHLGTVGSTNFNSPPTFLTLPLLPPFRGTHKVLCAYFVRFSSVWLRFGSNGLYRFKSVRRLEYREQKTNHKTANNRNTNRDQSHKQIRVGPDNKNKPYFQRFFVMFAL